MVLERNEHSSGSGATSANSVFLLSYLLSHICLSRSILYMPDSEVKNCPRTYGSHQRSLLAPMGDHFERQLSLTYLSGPYASKYLR